MIEGQTRWSLLCATFAAMQTPQTLGQRIKALRRQVRPKLTAAAAAEAIGIERPTLSTIENDHYIPGRDTLIAIADFYGVSIDWLRSGEGIPIRGPLNAEESRLLWLFRCADDAQRAALLTLAANIAGNEQPPDWISEPWRMLGEDQAATPKRARRPSRKKGSGAT